MQDFKSTYSQEIRDLAETFCSSTTRLSVGGKPEPRVLTSVVADTARSHGIDVGLLSQAILDYSEIEAQAEAQLRLG